METLYMITEKKKNLSKRYLLCDEVIVILIRKLHQKSPKCRVLNYQDKKSIELLLRWRRWKIGELGFFGHVCLSNLMQKSYLAEAFEP